MSKKIRVLLIAYTLAALIGLGGLAWASQSRLNWYRASSDLSAARAFEEAVTAADALSLSLKKLAYANDEALGKGLCAQAHAAALSCDTALSVLPFATQELEGLLGFLNRAGDYTASLCALSAETLEESDRQHLRDFGDAAASLADSLRQLQTKVHGG
ncbi:MAG: germination protein YpeB, partial [Oscillospiraceae bacterium]|nr:germination protein YpeB [Oscillospiraceae bacterium]